MSSSGNQTEIKEKSKEMPPGTKPGLSGNVPYTGYYLMNHDNPSHPVVFVFVSFCMMLFLTNDIFTTEQPFIVF